MNYFTVNKCGLYRQTSPKPQGLGITETFAAITDWVRGKPLGDTLPWNANARSGKAKCYCKDIYTSEATGDTLLVLWKSEASGNGSLLGAPEDAKTGEGNVVTQDGKHNGKKMIWGHPMYYWIVPSENLVVSIKFENSVCDSQLFQDWVAEAITNRVDHGNKKKQHTATGQTRLSFTDGTTGGDFRFRYLFDVSLKTENTANAAMTALASNITHIVKRETITLKTTDERALWVKLFNTFPHLKTAPNSKTREIEIKAQARPTAAEVKKIIDEYSRDNRNPMDWDNVGFITADNKTIWVDKYRLSNSIAYDIPKDQIVTAVDLGEAINKKRTNFLTPRIGGHAIVATTRTGT
ncbi:MAG TPA: hypothetical protein VL689_02355 [Paraburkholderia sp.]|jgi:hypothetical protein|nr:hypothetical protein [Paraburkholderia sp.]